MKIIILSIAISLLLGCDSQDMGKEVGKSYGEFVSSYPAKSIGKGISDASQGALFTALCENEQSTFSDTAQCYITPTGKRVWELDGKEKEYWMKVAIAEREKQIRRMQAEINHQRMESKREAAWNEEYALHCRFWKDQIPSEKKSQKINKYCSN